MLCHGLLSAVHVNCAKFAVLDLALVAEIIAERGVDFVVASGAEN